ncbi:MAG: hypothetical protein K8U57_38175 [Planctomycetes bacterium]|nr:hypothetical protein [Planctomycetota bacterium]
MAHLVTSQAAKALKTSEKVNNRLYAPTLGPVIVNVHVYDGPPSNNEMIANIIEHPIEVPQGDASRDFKLTAKDIKIRNIKQ